MGTKGNGGLGFLYENPFGRIILRILRAKWISVLAGAFLDTPLSKPLIKPFVRKNNIVLEDYETDGIKTFNEFFCRKIKPGKRTIDNSPDALIAPCDGLLSVYPVVDGAVYPVKQSEYTVSDLLKSSELAKKFEGGYVYVFRLCVNHYHRYSYPITGEKGDNTYIKGTFHTVRPIALRNKKVYCENAREYTLMESDFFGTVLQMEVGAMLVGKIDNYHGACKISKGEEKGKFLYGGSTVILLTQKGKAEPKAEFLSATEQGIETAVCLGERINQAE